MVVGHLQVEDKMVLVATFEELCFDPDVDMELLGTHVAQRGSAGGSVSELGVVLPAETFEEECVVEESFQLVESAGAEISLVGQFAVGVTHVEEESTVEELVVAVGRGGTEVVLNLLGHLVEQRRVDGEGDTEDGVH